MGEIERLLTLAVGIVRAGRPAQQNNSLVMKPGAEVYREEPAGGEVGLVNLP